MIPSPQHIARLHHASVGEIDYTSLSEEQQMLCMRACVAQMRDTMRYVVQKSQDSVKYKIEDSSTILLKDFPVSTVNRVEYHVDSDEVRILSSSGRTVARKSFLPHIDFTVVACKQLGRDMGTIAISLLSEIVRNGTPKETAVPISGKALEAALSRVGLRPGLVHASGGDVMYLQPWSFAIHWGMVESTGKHFWALYPTTTGKASHEGQFENSRTEDNAMVMARAIKEAVEDLTHRPPTSSPKPETATTWSVARTGDQLEAAGEPDENGAQGYVAEVHTFPSKQNAEAYARDVAPAYLVKGTQMWNEPVGQTEESDNALVRLIR